MSEMTKARGTILIISLEEILDAWLDGKTLHDFGPFSYCARVEREPYEHGRSFDLRDPDSLDLIQIKIGGKRMYNGEYRMDSYITVDMDEVMLFNKQALRTLTKYGDGFVHNLRTVNI